MATAAPQKTLWEPPLLQHKGDTKPDVAVYIGFIDGEQVACHLCCENDYEHLQPLLYSNGKVKMHLECIR